MTTQDTLDRREKWATRIKDAEGGALLLLPVVNLPGPPLGPTPDNLPAALIILDLIQQVRDLEGRVCAECLWWSDGGNACEVGICQWAKAPYPDEFCCSDWRPRIGQEER